MPAEVPPQARKRYAAGRRVRVPSKVKTVRDLLRRHLREEGYNVTELHRPWNIKPQSVKTVLHPRRALSPQYIDAAIEFFKLDEFDALELRLHGAIEAGWQITPALDAAIQVGAIQKDRR